MKNSKLYFKLLYIILFITALNCSKSNNEVSISITGTWDVATSTFSECTAYSGQTNGTTTYNCPVNLCWTFYFNSNNTFSDTVRQINNGTVVGSSFGSGTYTIKKNQLTLNYSSTNIITYSFALSGKKLTATATTTQIGCAETLVLNQQ